MKSVDPMPSPTLHAASSMPPLVERVEERRVGPCRLLLLQTPVRSVVSWEGSFRSLPDFTAGDEIVQELMVGLLDKGTQARDRFALAKVLEDRGARLSFSSEGLHVEVRGQALREHVAEVVGVMAEELRTPLFEAAELEKARARAAASIQRAMDSTGAQASSALRRLLYATDHPIYTPAPEDALARLAAVTPDEVRAYHAAHVGARAFVLVFVGDLDADAIEAAVREGLGDWADHDAPERFSVAAQPRPSTAVSVPMPDKQNVDVRLGLPLPIRRDDDAYVPLFLANHILGGNFSARLMTTVRDEMGLTYGIRSSLRGLTTDHAGHLEVSVTLSEENVERGIAATRAVVEQFVEEGATPEEVETHQTTVVGTFKVGLATTRGLAAALHRNAQRGFSVDYLDQFPRLIRSVEPDALNALVTTYVNPSALRQALAGNVEEKTS